ncbi:MAG: hypothetical protein RRX93_07030 [Bacteroidales bacterium]
MELEEKDRDLCRIILKKDHLEKTVGENTWKVFQMIRKQAEILFADMRDWQKQEAPNSTLKLEFMDRGKLEFNLKFSSDMLLFSMHTNVFEFSRNHEVMKTSYIKEDTERSYCGVIHIYNFLSDSIVYQRENDLGYLIGRVFVNKEMHYFIEGKQELGLIYTNFNSSVVDENACKNLLRAAMEYTSKFDLLTPPYDEIKEVTVANVQDEIAYKKLATGKRLGFRFQADQ